jgi:hypothetical protein
VWDLEAFDVVLGCLCQRQDDEPSRPAAQQGFFSAALTELFLKRRDFSKDSESSRRKNSKLHKSARRRHSQWPNEKQKP